jgi:hypothetical protein
LADPWALLLFTNPCCRLPPRTCVPRHLHCPAER